MSLRSIEPVEHGRKSFIRAGWKVWLHYEELIWLVYLGFWFLQPYYDKAPLWSWIRLAAAMIAFIVLYLLVHRGPKKLRAPAALGIFILGLVYVPFNQSACGIFIFLAATISQFTESTNVVLTLLLIECLTFILEAFLLHLSSWSWSVGSGIAFIVGLNVLHRRQQGRANAKLRLALDEIEKLAKTAERERIARDMHDVLGHSLSVIVLKSELAGRLMKLQPARATLEIAEIESTARRALAEVRKTITGYRAEGFASELARATHVLESAGVRVERPEQTPPLTARQDATLSMVLREAVTNIVRHAEASECSIQLSAMSESTQMVIADNGRGQIRAEGNGLRGMRERVQELGGQLLLESGHGTRLEIVLPQLKPQIDTPDSVEA